MIKFTVVFILILTISTSVLQNQPSYFRRNRRIVGGRSATQLKPWLVSIKSNGKFFCAGTIIGKKWILTASHCIHNRINTNLSISVNSITLDSRYMPYTVAKVIFYEKFDQETFLNDVAIMELAENLTNLKMMQLEDKPIGSSVDCEFYGWGRVQRFGDHPKVLQEIDLKTFPLSECKKEFEGAKIFTLNDKNICTVPSDNTTGTCSSDSGGPLIHDGKQVGILSWIVPCARGYPDVFTRISSYIGWIYKIIDEK